jgi:CheY-like chemotaxis protein
MTYKVLIVDDVATIRGFVRAAIAPLNYSILEAPNGARALELCRQEQPDLVVTDWNMPGMRGDELIKHIRAEDPETRIIVLTAEGARDQVGAMLALDIQGYVLKPFQLPALRRRIEAILLQRLPRSALPPQF